MELVGRSVGWLSTSGSPAWGRRWQRLDWHKRCWYSYITSTQIVGVSRDNNGTAPDLENICSSPNDIQLMTFFAPLSHNIDCLESQLSVILHLFRRCIGHDYYGMDSCCGHKLLLIICIVDFICIRNHVKLRGEWNMKSWTAGGLYFLLQKCIRGVATTERDAFFLRMSRRRTTNYSTNHWLFRSHRQ